MSSDGPSSPLGGSVSPEKLALVMGGSEERFTYRQLRAETDAAVDLLASHDLSFADHVALLFANESALFPFAWAAQRTGLFYTPVNWHLGSNEAAYIVGDCDAKVLVTSPVHRELSDVIRRAVPGLQTIVAGEAADAGPRPGDQLPQRWNGFPMFYSSGTTGHPKGIVREPIRVAAGTPGPIHQLMQALYGLGSDSTLLVTGPLYHAAPLDWSIATQSLGGAVVAMERFDALATLELIDRYQVTHLQLVPTMMNRLLKLPMSERRRFSLSSLKTVVHAAAPCPINVKREMIDWLGPIIWEYYAGSEANGYFAIDSTDWLRRPGSVGRSVFGEPHILDDDGNEIGPGEVGTVWFEGTGAFQYHKDPEKTASVFNDHGWSTLGDVGNLDEDGYLFLSDRRVDLIISGGVNIYPQEVENVLMEHPAVCDVAVVGAADDDLGQRVVAVVQLEVEHRSPAPAASELIAFCDGRLARFKRPREILFSEDLPRLPSGKMLRRRVREQLGSVADR